MVQYIMPTYYVLPRAERAKKRPFRLSNGGAGGGEAALIASVIGQAQNDFLAGDDLESFNARAYFSSDVYQHHAGVLGVEFGIFPDGITAIAIEVSR